jgi:hypothetical protein
MRGGDVEQGPPPAYRPRARCVGGERDQRAYEPMLRYGRAGAAGRQPQGRDARLAARRRIVSRVIFDAGGQRLRRRVAS